MPTVSAATTPPIPERVPTPSANPDRFTAMRQLASLHQLLGECNFPGHAAQRVCDAINFVAALHLQLSSAAETEAAPEELKANV